MPNTRKLSPHGLKFLTECEGYRTAVYRDSSGYPTVGVGHLLTTEEKKKWPVGTRLDYQTIQALLAYDVQRFEKAVCEALDPDVLEDLSQNGFDALVSLSFNIGPANFKRSSLVKLLNSGDEVAAANAFAKYNRSKGQVVAGLTRRRALEKQLFLTPDPEPRVSDPVPPTDEPTDAQKPTEPTEAEPAIADTSFGTPSSTVTGQEQSVALPVETGGARASVHLGWQIPTFGSLCLAAWTFVKDLITTGQVNFLDAVNTAAGLLRDNFYIVSGLGVAAVLYMLVRKILTYVPTVLAWHSATRPELNNVNFVSREV